MDQALACFIGYTIANPNCTAVQSLIAVGYGVKVGETGAPSAFVKGPSGGVE